MDRIDINDAKPALEKTMNKIRALPESANKTTLLQYADWHQQKLNQNTMSLLSVKKSLDVAFQVTAFCKNINDLNQKEIEDWWAYQLERQANQTKRKGTKEVIQIQTERKLSQGSILKLSSQSLKYIKFVSFLKRGKPASFYNSKREKIPECAECLFVSPAPSLPEQKPSVSQKQIQQIINHLSNKGNRLGEMTATFVSLINDTGLRFSEAASLRHCDIKIEDNYYLISLNQSKTATRTVISYLSKNRLKNWISRNPTKNNTEGLIFCNLDGTKIKNTLLSREFKRTIKDLNITWKKRSVFHFLRHLFVARTIGIWTEDVRNYYMGWSQKGMLSVYGDFNCKQALPFYMKMIQVEQNPMIDEPLSYLDENEQKEYKFKMKNEMLQVLIEQGIIPNKKTEN